MAVVATGGQMQVTGWKTCVTLEYPVMIVFGFA